MPSRFLIAARMLRGAGLLNGIYGDERLPGQRRKESPIDWLVRLGLAQTPQLAAEMLIMGAGLTEVLNETEALLNNVEEVGKNETLS